MHCIEFSTRPLSSVSHRTLDTNTFCLFRNIDFFFFVSVDIGTLGHDLVSCALLSSALLSRRTPAWKWDPVLQNSNSPCNGHVDVTTFECRFTPWERALYWALDSRKPRWAQVLFRLIYDQVQATERHALFAARRAGKRETKERAKNTWIHHKHFQAVILDQKQLWPYHQQDRDCCRMPNDVSFPAVGDRTAEQSLDVETFPTSFFCFSPPPKMETLRKGQKRPRIREDELCTSSGSESSPENSITEPDTESRSESGYHCVPRRSEENCIGISEEDCDDVGTPFSSSEEETGSLVTDEETPNTATSSKGVQVTKTKLESISHDDRPQLCIVEGKEFEEKFGSSFAQSDPHRRERIRVQSLQWRIQQQTRPRNTRASTHRKEDLPVWRLQ